MKKNIITILLAVAALTVQAQTKVRGIGTEVNPESWTQLKGSNETNF